MLEECLGDKILNVNKVTANSASAYQEFCKNHNVNLIAIPSGFHNDGTNNLAEINGLHSQLEVWLTKFRFTMKKRFDFKNLKIKSYKNIIINNSYIETKKICNIPMLIDLNVAYAEYN